MNDLFSYADNLQEPEVVELASEVLTVTQLSNQLRLTVENTFNFVMVEGEISSLRTPASGHMYFKLKDENNLINGIIWRGTASKLKTPIEDGAKVIVYGRLTTYGARSEYQIIVNKVEIAGVGDLMQQFEELKAKLSTEGLFDEYNKQQIPVLPEVIGIVTSPTGAVIDDMLHRISDRFPRHIVLWPTLVQGEGAKEQIGKAIAGFNNLDENSKYKRPDVIIVARGGGSLEDLWAFNEEIVVRAIAASKIPVISAVGHEPDVTLCDYVADLRAPTPTAAAEMVVPVRQDLQYTINQRNIRLQQAIINRIALMKKQLAVTVHQLPDPQNHINQARLRLEDKSERFAQVKVNYFKFLNQKLEAKKHLLESFSPKSTQKRGFIYATDADGQVVKSAKTTAKQVNLHFVDGERTAELS